MTETNGKGQIVVGTDGSHNSYRALDWALAEASLRGAAILLVHAIHVPVVATPMFPAPVRVYEDLDNAGKTLLDQALAYARRDAGSASGVRVDGLMAHGSPAAILPDASRGALLLVVGSRGHGALAGALLGSVSAACVHHAHCPVVVIPPGTPTTRTGVAGEAAPMKVASK